MNAARSENPVELILRRSVWSLAAISFACLLSTRELSFPTILIIITLFPAFLFFERRDRLHRVPWFENSLVVLFFAASVARLTWNKEPFVNVMADFLTAFLLLKCAFKKTRGDLVQMIALSFFVLLSASTLALDFTYLIGFLAYVAAAAWTLCLLTVTRRPLPEGATPADNRALLSQAGRIGALTVLTVLVLGTGVFVIFPRLSFTVFRGEFLRPARTTGFSETMSLNESGRIYRDPRIMMRIEIAPEQNDGRWNGKLRGMTLSHFDGSRWSVKGPDDPAPEAVRLRGRTLIDSVFQIFHADSDGLARRTGMKISRKSYLMQKIYLEPMETSVLFGATWPQFVRLAVPELLVGPDLTISRPPRFRGRVAYQVRSLVESPREGVGIPDPRPGREPFFAPDEARFLQLPDSLKDAGDPSVQKMRRLLKGIISPEDGFASKARKIETHLRNNHRYTLSRKNSGENPLEDFLFGSKEGHCEYFASAMAALLRLDGIPCRVVTGFVARDWNEAGSYYVVRGRDAHSWIEARIDGIWREYDPSPPSRFESGQEGGFWKEARQTFDHLNFLWNAHVLGYDLESQQRVAVSVASGSRSLNDRLSALFRRREKSAPGERRTRIPFSSAALILILASVVAGMALIKRSSRVKPARADGKNDPVALYRGVLNSLARKGFPRRPPETPKEFEQRAQRTGLSGAAELSLLTDGFYEARFAGRTFSQPEIAQLRNAADRLRQALKKRR